MPRSVLALLIFVAGAGLGFALSLLLAGDAPISGASVPAGPAVARSSAGGSRSGPSSSEAGPATPITTGGYDQSVQAGVEGAVPPDPPLGDGQITGTVKTDDGRPLEGVALVAYPQRGYPGRRPGPHKGDGPPEDRDLRVKVQRFVEQEQWRESRRREARTDARGEFVLTGLSEDGYTLEAWLRGWDVSPATRGSGRVKAGATVDFIASPVVSVRADVRLPDGRQPEKATVTWRGGASNTLREEWDREAPEIRLAPGAYALTAVAGESEEYRSEAQSILVKQGEPGPALTFNLKARTGLKGHVKVPSGHPDDQILVFALRFETPAPPGEDRLRQEGRRDWAGAWNGYAYSMMDVAAGTYLVGAGSYSGVLATTIAKVADGQITEADIQIAEAEASGGLVVWVRTPDGGLAFDATVHVGGDEYPDPRQRSTVRRRKDGAFVVVVKRSETAEDRPGPRQLSVQSARYGRKQVDLPSPPAGELQITLDEPSSLEVTLTGYLGTPMVGKVSLDLDRPRTSSSRRSFSMEVGEDPGLSPEGRKTFAPLQPGPYTLTLYRTSWRMPRSPMRTIPVEVGPGKNTVSVAVPPAYTLTLIAGKERADGHCSLHLTGEGAEDPGYGFAEPVGPDGQVVFDSIPAGTYRVQLWGPGSEGESMKVVVPGPATVTFRPDAEIALVVRDEDGESYLEALGLRRGDVIVGTREAAFDGSRPASQVLRGLLLARAETTLLVRRAGQTSEIKVDCQKFSRAMQRHRLFDPVDR